MAQLKKIIISLGGVRTTFSLPMLGYKFLVDYNLRSTKPDRDYATILALATGKACIFDVGANHGVISLLLMAQNADAKIHAFEASEAAVNVINHNVTLNNFAQSIKVINTLVADRSGYSIPFYWEGSSGGASITKGRLGHNIEIFKSTISLDDYASAHKVSPDFIKMDIEGAENIAIKGMEKILSNSRPDVFIELHDFGEKKLFENAQDILNFVKPLDYWMIYLRTGKPIENIDELKGRGRCHVFLQPRERYSENYFKSLDLSGL